MGLIHFPRIFSMEKIPRLFEWGILALFRSGLREQSKNGLRHDIGRDDEMDVLFGIFAQADEEIKILNRALGVIYSIILIISNKDRGRCGSDCKFVTVVQG